VGWTGLRGSRTVAVALVLALLAGCTAGLRGGDTKAGGDSRAHVLRMGTADAKGRLASEQIVTFAREVDARSHGSLVIDPVYSADAGGPGTGWDQRVARRVVSGDLDLGMIPARAWDTEGVTSLRALQAPFLVSTDDRMRAVAENGELATDLMAGLRKAGVTGLALVPEGLRHLFLFRSSALEPADLRGARIRVPRSAVTWSLFSAWGARPTDADADATTFAAESSYALTSTLPDTRAIVGNLVPYARIDTLVINDAAMARLTSDQRRIVREAANATRDEAVAHSEPDAVSARRYCDGGGTVIALSPSVLAAFRKSAAPVTTSLRADPETGGLMDRIAALADSRDAAAPLRCAPGRTASGGISAEEIVADGGELPDGTYRAEYTDRYLVGRVLHKENVVSNHGVWTFTLDDGRWTFDQTAADGTDHDEGVYEVRGRDLYWVLAPGGRVLHLRWSTDADGDLHFEQVEDAAALGDPSYPYPDFQFGVEWVRVG